MAKYTYPAVFEKEQDGGFSIYFPDIEGCYTQADEISEGIENAGDALCLMMYELEKSNRPIPVASDLKNFTADEKNITTLIACDTRFYKNYFEGQSVKIDTTLPLWLKEEGERQHVNFSQLLQSALKEHLRIGA